MGNNTLTSQGEKNRGLWGIDKRALGIENGKRASGFWSKKKNNNKYLFIFYIGNKFKEKREKKEKLRKTYD